MSMLTRRMPDVRPAQTHGATSPVLGNRYVQAAGMHLAVQGLGVLVLWLLASSNDHGLIDRLTAWDGQWYLAIARDGYGGQAARALNPELPYASLAFFPLYPILIALLGVFGISYIAAGLIVSTVAGLAASCGIMRLAGHVDSRRRAGLVLVALHAGAPLAITMSMVYTEALFVAFTVWTLVGILERGWGIAGLCCMFAGLTRSTATVLITVVVLSALIAVWRDKDRIALLSACLAPVGLLTFWGHVALETGSPTGWQDIQERGWGMGFDFGLETATWFAETVTTGSSVMYVGIAALLVTAPVLVVWCVRLRIPWPLVAYAAGVITLAIGTGGLEMTKARLLLPAACVLLLPVAASLASRSRVGMVAGTAAIVVPGVWFSAYALTIWEHAI